MSAFSNVLKSQLRRYIPQDTRATHSSNWPMSPSLTIPHLPGQGASSEFSVPSGSHLPVLLSQCIWLRGFSVMDTEMSRLRKRGQWHPGASTAREIPVAARMPVRMPAEERACLLCLNVFFSKTHILSEMWRAEIETRPHMKLSPVPGSSSPALPPSYLQCVMRLAGSPNSLVAKLFLSIK